MHDDKAFYERRLKEELHWADAEEEPSLKFLHLRWANLYKRRLQELERSSSQTA